MGEINSRLRLLVDELANGKYTVFAKKAGIPHSTFQNYIKSRTPHLEHLLRIHDVFRVDLNWLLTGKGERFISKESQRPEEGENIVELQHMDLIREFKDKDRAKSINQGLIELERLSDTAFREMEIYIKGVVNGIKYAEKESKPGEETAETPSARKPDAGTRRLRVRNNG